MKGARSIFLTAIVYSATTFGGDLCAQVPAGADYIAGEVQNGGTISGRVQFKGAPPALKLAVNQDRDKCKHEEGFVRSPRLRVGPAGGLADAVVYLKSIARGKPLEQLKVAMELDQIGCLYTPFVQIAPIKSRLKISSSDPVLHNVNGKIGDKQLFNYAMPNPDYPKKRAIETRPLTQAGILAINCDTHLWMSAYVWVVRHPYYAVSGEDGAFELGDVPPGEYELAAWHAGWDAQARKNAQGQVIGYAYADPMEKSIKVKVEPGGRATVEFILNE